MIHCRLIAILTFGFAAWPLAAEPTIIRLPDAALVPDVAMDARGVLHMVYGQGDNALYVRSADNGKTLSEPVKVNHEGKVTLTMGERGPRIALGKNGAIHVVWQDKWFKGAQVFVRHSRSLDGGKTFEPARPVSSMFGVDGTTLAADEQGNVLVFWHTAHPPQEKIKSATPLHMTRSSDNGATFGESVHLRISGLGELACSMCMMRARCIGDSVYLAFRTAEENIRDFYVLQSPVAGNDFKAIRVNEDNWLLQSCPMCGPEITLTPDGRLLCAFMSRNRAYWSITGADRTRFTGHFATPGNEKDEIYPCAVANKAGQVLMTWNVGPMAVGKRSTVKWAIFTPEGKPTGKQGTIGASTSGTKPTAFVGTDDRFYIVTTAK